MRTFPALLLTAGLVASLTSCAPATFAPDCESSTISGDASSVVTAAGSFGTAPTVDFPTPLVTTKLQRTELITGTGERLNSGETALIKFTILSGATGEVLQRSDYTSASTSVSIDGSSVPAVSQGLKCASLGSRVAIVSSAQDSGQTGPDASTDALVFVIDITRVFPARAHGIPQIPQSGMPSVVTAPDGTPGITVPKQDPPKTLSVNTLLQGSGPTLKAADQVVLKYTGFLWGDSSVFHSTWTEGDASFIALTASDSVTAGFVDGLIGQTVGSQVLIVVPPADGFGEAGTTGVPSGSTLIYVVDVLGVVG